MFINYEYRFINNYNTSFFFHFTSFIFFFFFQFLNSYLSIGPPMYFVVKEGLNYSDKRAQNLVCGGQYCNSDSVSTQIFIASKQSNR